MIVHRCGKCGYTGKFEYRFKLKIFLLLFILTAIIFALPALYYALTRGSSYRCPKCGETEKIEVGITCEHCGYESLLKKEDGATRWFFYGLYPDFGAIDDTMDSEVTCPRCGEEVGAI